MKAITYQRYGPPEALQLREVDRPEPGPGEVLIRVRAAEATKGDCEIRAFRFPVVWFWLPLRLAIGVRRPRRPILGSYFAGEVVEVGASVDRLSVGQEVFGVTSLKMGAYAECVTVPARSSIVSKPRNMTFVEAAAVPLGGLNALHFLRRAEIRVGERVLINGAGGSIGTHAIQIAKSHGAEVTAVDRGDKEEALRRFGADAFIDYTKRSFTTDGPAYDVVFDMVASSSFRECLSVLRSGGRYLKGNPRLLDFFRGLVANRTTEKRVTLALARETREELEELVRMIERGDLGPIVDRVFSMDEAAQAHRAVEAEQRRGAVVIEMVSSEERAERDRSLR